MIDRIPFFALTLLLLISSFRSVDASSVKANDKNTSAPKYAVLPVFYLTDRNKEGDSFGPHRRYTVNCQHHMYYGVSHVPILNENSRVSDTLSEKLGWQWIDSGKTEKISKKDEITADNPAEEKKQFFNRLWNAIVQSGSNRLCVFLHGGADPFEDSLADAAEMAYFMDCPALIYAWPSVGKLNRYRVDEGNVEWSQEHFNTFLLDLEEFLKEHPCKLTFIAHSMGNRLLARAAGLLRGNAGVIHDVALVSPDIDAETFEHYVMGYHNRGTKVRLYVSNRDKVLPFTQMLYGGYYRLGEGVGAVLSMVSLQQKANAQDVSVSNRLIATPGTRMEKIDFTKVDKGIIGHELPFELVANMSRYGKPPEGFVLVPGIEGQGNKFASYGRWRNKLGPLDENTPGYCKHVVPVAELKKYDKLTAAQHQ